MKGARYAVKSPKDGHVHADVARATGLVRRLRHLTCREA